MSILAVHDTPIKSGHHLTILDSVMRSFSQEYEIANVLPHMGDKELKKIKPERWLEESERILSLSSSHDKILALGGIAAATVFESERTLPVTKVRGRGFVAPNGKYTVPTFSPSTIVKDTDFFRDLVFDVEKLVTHDGPMEQPEMEILLLESVKDLALLKDLHGASFMAADIEYDYLFGNGIIGIGFAVLNTDGTGYVTVVPQHLIRKEVHTFLRTFKGTTIFHNAMFDVRHLWEKFGHFKFHKLADTMLMNWCLDERPFNRYRSHGLDLLQRLYFDAPPKSVNMTEWLKEYYRVDVGTKARVEWVETFCAEHAEMARTEWRKWHEAKTGQEPTWRGLKVGRDIPVPTVAEAVMLSRMPKEMLPPPTKDRKEQMWNDMMRYMGEDCFSTVRLYPILRDKMDDESERLMHLHDSYLIPAAQMFAQMRTTGTQIDIPYMVNMKKEIELQLDVDMKDIRAIVTEYTSHPKGVEFNPNSSKQVKEVLYDENIGAGLEMPKGVGRYAYKRDQAELTTNSDTLKVLARQVAKDRPAISKLINQILTYRVKSKILGTYVDGILERVDPDGRIRCDFNLHGTATARVSSSNPNLQNIPDASHVGFDIRKAYIPTEGWVMLEADYSQLELRVAALFSQDEVLMDVYHSGGDIHQEVAFMLWNKPKDQITKYERYLAKCMNFGVLYGRGYKSIATGPEMDNLVEMSGRSWSEQEIGAYFAKFKEGYSDLFAWMDLVKKNSMKKQYVENPLGHRRRFDLILQAERGHIERQTVNTPIQGFAAQCTINACTLLNERFDPNTQRLLFTVHDSIMAECHPSLVRETAQLIKTTMENDLPQDVIVSFPTLPHSPFKEGDQLEYNLPFVADVVVGKSWGECYDEAENFHMVEVDEHGDPFFHDDRVRTIDHIREDRRAVREHSSEGGRSGKNNRT